jgi:hypothetical protein
MAAPGHFVPGVSRPSTSLFVSFQDVYARHKAGHDRRDHNSSFFFRCANVRKRSALSLMKPSASRWS